MCVHTTRGTPNPVLEGEQSVLLAFLSLIKAFDVKTCSPSGRGKPRSSPSADSPVQKRFLLRRTVPDPQRTPGPVTSGRKAIGRKSIVCLVPSATKDHVTQVIALV